MIMMMTVIQCYQLKQYQSRALQSSNCVKVITYTCVLNCDFYYYNDYNIDFKAEITELMQIFNKKCDKIPFGVVHKGRLQRRGKEGLAHMWTNADKGGVGDGRNST